MSPPQPAVNVYLYQVTPNAAHQNNDAPTRRSDGTLTQRPQAAFDLHCLFTFHGNDATLQPQLLVAP
jgi:Pvc16 N-terminal domain